MLIQAIDTGYQCSQSGISATGATKKESFLGCMLKLGYKFDTLERFMKTTQIEIEQAAKKLARRRCRQDYRQAGEFRNKYPSDSVEFKAYNFEMQQILMEHRDGE